MLMKEFRICMPLTVEEYRIGQLYMISKHSHEQSDRGEGVEVVQNEPYEDPTHGNGQYTEKRVYLNSKLPSWARAVVPRIFYVTEKAWNYYPYTITEYTCSFLPKFFIHIETKYEDNNGSNDNIFDSEAKDIERDVCFIDIAYDEIPDRYYKDSEDLRYFKSEKTQRGMLKEGWRETQKPIMCSYKLVTVKFEVWGLQTRVEQFVLKVIRDVLMIGHRQAFAWVDEWYDMTMDDVRNYEKNMHEQTNIKVWFDQPSTNSPSADEIQSDGNASVCYIFPEVHFETNHPYFGNLGYQNVFPLNKNNDNTKLGISEQEVSCHGALLGSELFFVTQLCCKINVNPFSKCAHLEVHYCH